MSFDGKTYWIIGASEGLGRALAEALTDMGCRVIASARSEARLRDLGLPESQVIACDVTSETSVAEAVKALPPLDGIIYCAGIYDPMSATEWNQENALQMMDVNVLGAMRVLPLVLPDMLSRNDGHIVLIGSLAAYHGLPGAIGYSTSKAALMHLAENLYLDLKAYKTRVQIINPGFIKTRLTSKNSFQMTQIMTPEVAAKHVIRTMQSKRFRSAFPQPFAWLFQLLKYLPDRCVRRIF